ncbi:MULTISPECIES: Crp/Fnr family transcriptional regulator [Methyloceanibacter]|uniref:Nitric oxide-responding transcriptional regulator NnrR n=1 Tax=Methyloceanibacter caenitepidi TaxID=1384459 RepID=A0A0A8K232_9HYPH|nr:MULTISPECIES: Crp/Fnr family transcriptional regulator [Methyloceanibacter]BAQ16582.1 nitric oxide -responding transcriptional regulator NnrR [Methyloceanibacter caenitepidi]
MTKLDRSLIQALPVFAEMDVGELDDVIARAKAQRIPKGTAVFRQGEPTKSFFVLLHGRLKVVKVTPSGQQVLIRFVNPGDIYGIAKALSREDYPATATAVIDSVTLVWPSDIWDEFMTSHPSMSLNVMRMMGDRLQEAHTRVKELSTEEVERRVAHTLLRLIAQSGRSTEEGVMIDFPITQQDLAQASGTTFHSVSRILSGWESEGLVTIGRRKVVVSDVEGLSHLAEQAPSGKE